MSSATVTDAATAAGRDAIHDGLKANRISTGFYDAGHMMYLKPSAQKLHDDVAQFIAASLQ